MLVVTVCPFLAVAVSPAKQTSLKGSGLIILKACLPQQFPCWMSENQREETVVGYKWQREMSEDTKRRERKKKKNEACKLYMLEFSLNQKVLQKKKKYLATSIVETVMSPTFLLQSGFL